MGQPDAPAEAICLLFAAPETVKMVRMTLPSHAELLREYLDQLSQPGSEGRLPVWKDWMRLRVGGAMALGAALGLAACGGDSDDQNNQGGAAGMVQMAGAGGSSASTTVGTLYGVPMTGGTNSEAGGTSSITSAAAVYAVPMVGGSSSGGVSAGVRYAVPLGGQGATQGSSTEADGGVATVPLYAIVMVAGGSKSS